MKKIGRPKLKLMVDEPLVGEVRRLFRSTKNVKYKERLQIILLASGGQPNDTHEEIASVVRRARSYVQALVKCFKKGGIVELLARGKATGKLSDMQKPAVQKGLVDGLREGRWRTAGQLATWLEKEHGIRRATQTMYY